MVFESCKSRAQFLEDYDFGYFFEGSMAHKLSNFFYIENNDKEHRTLFLSQTEIISSWVLNHLLRINNEYWNNHHLGHSEMMHIFPL